MHHPVAEGGGTDQAWLGIADAELPVGAGAVDERAQFLLQTQQLRFQVGVEGQHRGPIALATLGTAGGGLQAGEAGEAGVEIRGGHQAGRRCWASQALC